MGEDVKERIEAAAREAVSLAKTDAYARAHFMACAVGRLRDAVDRTIEKPLATDGALLMANPELVLRAFREAGAQDTHGLLHTVMHCVFCHPYVGPAVERASWDVACDVAAERAVAEVVGWRPGELGAAQAACVDDVERLLGGKAATAERVYRLLRSDPRLSREDLVELFSSDDHAPWYRGAPSGGQGGSEAPGVETGGGARGRGGRGAGEQPPGETVTGDGGLAAPAAGLAGREAGEGSRDDEERYTSLAPGLSMRGVPEQERQRQMAAWRDVATSLALDIANFSRLKGRQGLVCELEEAVRERTDYSSFLRQFAVVSEAVKVSQDEFDYALYCFGLERYGDVPLVEPLEYREEKRVRDFAVVIDTSGSVQGDAVRRFVDATFDILKSTESFHTRVRVAVVQCDASVRSVDVVDDLGGLAEWGRTMVLRGGGGTDFRPAFDLVESMVASGELSDLGGLVYFTDGYGVYPERMPPFKTAFVFYDDSYRREEVPPWAIQVVLGPEEVEGL